MPIPIMYIRTKQHCYYPVLCWNFEQGTVKVDSSSGEQTLQQSEVESVIIEQPTKVIVDTED